MTLETYKKRAFWPLSLLAIVFLYIFCASNFHFSVAEKNSDMFSVINIIVWLAFALDFLVMVYLSKNKKEFFRTHIFHLVVVIVPFLRVMRIGLLVLMLTNVLGTLRNRVLISVPIYTGVAAALFVLLGASAVYNAEYQADGSNIRTIEDAFWWAVVTIFTVGYGDKFPVTSEGRLYGVGLMLCGIAIVGTVTATFAGWLISQIREVESENAKILKKLEKIEQRLI